MRTVTRFVLVTSLLLAPASLLSAQPAGDPSGHWTGAIHVPAFNGAAAREVAIDVDLATNAKGEVAGTFSQPAQHVKGLPLSKVSVTGKTVSFELKATAGGGLFNGTLADATSMSGEFVTTEGGYNIPFDLKRTGDAQIAAAPRNAAIGKDLEGTWNGTVEYQGKKERLVLKLANQSDGTATGTIVDLDGSNMEIPVAMTQKGADVTIQVATVNAAYTAKLTGTELAGTWAQGGLELPLTMTRAAK
jgi:hypothetical protein